MISDARYQKFLAKKRAIDAELDRLSNIRIKPSDEVNAFVQEHGDKPLQDGVIAAIFLRRPYVDYQTLMRFIPASDQQLDRHVIEQVEIQTKYAGYIKKAEQSVAKMKKMEAKKNS